MTAENLTGNAIDSAVVHSVAMGLFGSKQRDFKLTNDQLTILEGEETVTTIPLNHVSRLNIRYSPAKRKYNQFVTTIETVDGSKIEVVNANSERVQPEKDKSFCEFTRTLYQNVASANPQAVFEKGSSAFAYNFNMLVYGSLIVTMIIISVVMIWTVLVPIVFLFVLFRYILPTFKSVRAVNKAEAINPTNIPSVLLPPSRKPKNKKKK